MHQEAQYPGRQHGVALQNPDFALMGESYGALGLKVTRDEEFLPAFKKALAADRSALIEVQTRLRIRHAHRRATAARNWPGIANQARASRHPLPLEKQGEG